MNRALAGLAIGAALVFLPGLAHAQRTIEVERFRPALDRHGFLGIQGTRTPGHGLWNFNLWLDYDKEPFVLEVPTSTDERQEVAVTEHRLTNNFQAQMGLGSRLALAVDWPVVWWQDGDAAPLGQDLATIAAGDPRLIARARVVGQPTEAGQQRAEGFGLAVLAASTVPVGTEDGFAAEESAVTDLQLLADFHILGAGIGAMLGWRHRFENVRIGAKKMRDELEAGLAVKVPIPQIAPGFSSLAELRTTTDAKAPFGDSARTAVEVDVGASFHRGDFTLRAALGGGLTDGVGTPQVRAILGLSWAPRVHDADDDGVPDDEDECAHLPEDFDEFEDEDGCLDPDNDNDMIPDEDDQCPNEQAAMGRDRDMDGCTDPPREDSSRNGVKTPEPGASEQTTKDQREAQPAASESDGGEEAAEPKAGEAGRADETEGDEPDADENAGPEDGGLDADGNEEPEEAGEPDAAGGTGEDQTTGEGGGETASEPEDGNRGSP